ncbi:arginine--tRNA ligase [Brachyspira pilosicoli]|uniref:Arginine--tRNA ligase n=1 Tax=Brachyspira pilosicoli TaxID=52584 RepID=A0AAJ6GG49_BRAPL|nr:arginine--tRNA ligase [Brachyspira pilosicoli]WIH89866.1 arginine--tRNA ligase [Brachyspira pilosicoli]WIH92161.1 arginine--tRNA ligase [Brachyspira pilosicoli]WIH94390.1 arginine--tRNA ligase [Brachyspira pilosicoli]
MLKKIVSDIIKEALCNYLKDTDVENIDSYIDIGYTVDEKFGDYASPVAMRLAKALKKNPFDIANDIVKLIDKKYFDNVEVARPGFINLTLSKDYINECINQLLEDDDYGKNSAEDKKRILVEYVSANPTGPLHIGHGRWAAIGSALSNILKYVGHDVYQEFYVNDAGEQITKLNESVNAVKEGREIPEDGYHGAYIKDIAKMEGVPKDIILEQQRKLLERFRTYMDNYASELKIREGGELEKTIDYLNEKGLLFEEDNATWFKSTKYGDDKDRVVKKSNGSYTYFAPDITYHKNKIDRGYKYLIDILGADHHGYVPRITAAVRAVSDDTADLKVILGQLVRLYRGNELVRMSKRTGDMISLEEVIDEIGVDPTRYFLLMRSYSSSLDFDLELAKKKDNDNPVYYVQYAYARVCNIFFKLEEKNMKYDYNKKFDINKISNESTLKLAKMILRFPDEIYESAKSLEVYTLLNYTYDVASALHKFYYDNIVLEENDDIRQERLTLIRAVKKILGICFDIIGITKIERMYDNN